MSNGEAVVVPTWKRVCAFIVDFVLSLLVFGGAIAAATGKLGKQPDGTTGFSLDGAPAAAAMACMVLYFWLGGRYGFRIGNLLFGIKRRPAAS